MVRKPLMTKPDFRELVKVHGYRTLVVPDFLTGCGVLDRYAAAAFRRGRPRVARIAVVVFLATRNPEPACVPAPGSEVCQTPATELIQERLYATLP